MTDETHPGEGRCKLCGRSSVEAGPLLVAEEGLLCRSCRHSRVKVRTEVPPVHEGGAAEAISPEEEGDGSDGEDGGEDGSGPSGPAANA